VTNELGEEEKIDIILWSDDPVNFISHALAPAKVEEVQIKPNQEARVLVAPDQQSLAIGRGGQNVRLAARLTGWHIEIRSTAKPDETIEGGQSTPANDKTEPMPAQESSSEERSESSEKSQENTEK
jgi:N utilization substance protein A